MREKLKTIILPEAQLGTLAHHVQGHASQLEFESRWAEDRDEAHEWRGIAQSISHLAFCPYRKRITGTSPVEITLYVKTWAKIQGLLKTEKQAEKLHALYTKLYPEQIKRFKRQIKALEMGKELDPDLTKDLNQLNETVVQREKEIAFAKQRHLSTKTALNDLIKRIR